MAKTRTLGTDDNGFSLITKFGGYNSSIDPTNAPSNILVQGSQNVYKTSAESVAVRPGRKLWDSATDSTLFGIKAGYVWNTSLGGTTVLRVQNSSLQFASSLTGTQVWYNLLTGLSVTRFVFDTWWDNTDKKDTLVMVAGNSSLYAWSGGTALFVSATATVITLDRSAATAGFASTGSVTINGNNYTYTGISGSTLTGTSDASAETANSMVFSRIVTNANTPATGFNGDFLKVVGNQVYVGSYTSRIIYISKNTSYTDYTHSTPRLTGEGDTVILDTNAKGIGARLDVAYVFGGTSDVYPITFQQITVGSVLTEQTKRGKIQLGNLMSALGHEFIDAQNDNIIYLDQSNQLRSYGSFRNQFKDKPIHLSLQVQDELFETDFTGGQVKAISDRGRDIIYITSPTTGKTYWYQELSFQDSAGNIQTERIWQPPFGWNISRIDTIAGLIYGFSNSNPQIYKLWDTAQWHDDSPSGSLNYSCVLLLAYQNGGLRQGKIAFEKLFYEGYLTNGTPLYGAIYYDYQGYSGVGSIVLNATDDLLPVFFSGTNPPSLGDASLGDNPLGDGLFTATNDHGLLSKFKLIKGIEPKDCYEFALMLYSNSADARWEMLAIGTNLHLSPSVGTEITK